MSILILVHELTPFTAKHSFLVKAWESLPESKLTLLNVDSDRPVVLKSRPHDPRPKKMVSKSLLLSELS